MLDSLTAPALLYLPPLCRVSAHLEFDQITRERCETALQARVEENGVSEAILKPSKDSQLIR
jgi:hypothetical protein